MAGRERGGFEFLDKEFEPTSLTEAVAVQRDIWIKTLVESLENVNRVSTGALAQSININIEDKQGSFKFTLFMEDYWKWVDEGRLPGGKQPPQKAMLEFIKVRGIQPKNGIPRRGKGISKDKKLKSLAFAMAKSIKQKGIKATNFYTSEVDQLKEGFIKAIGVGIAKDIEIQFE